MLLLDIANNIEDYMNIDNIINIKFLNNYETNTDHCFTNNQLINEIIKINDIYEINAKVIGFLGEGSYGKVYKIKINSNFYALKINTNEIPEKLNQRYNSLNSINELQKYIINIYVSGKIISDENKYFSIMEYGGDCLKNNVNKIKLPIMINILKQLFNISYLVTKHKILMTDLKLGNLTINDEGKLTVIDIYMECESYIPCKQCRIIKTYSTIEIETERRIYENPDYNFTCVYIPLAICLIDLLCERSASYYFSKLAKKYEINLNIKGMIPLLQVACYNYSNDSNHSIKNYKKIYERKKKLETKFPCLKMNEFYEYFLKLLKPKFDYKDYIGTKRLLLILNDLFSIDPEQRKLYFLKDKLTK